MPVEPCTVDGGPGRRWGSTGTCYPCSPGGDCTGAEDKAKAQGRAINAEALTSPGRATSARIRTERALARAIHPAVERYLREVRAEAMAALRAPVLLAAARRPAEPFTLGSVNRPWVRLSAEILGVVTKASTAREYRAAVEARLRADPLPMATFDAVRALLLQATEEGWTQRKVRAQMTETLRLGTIHAERIARTEATASVNAETLNTLHQVSDRLPWKRWVSSHDARVRPTHVHADGQTVPISTAFSVGAEALMYPGDPSGSDAETANCRCVTVGVARKDSTEEE